jgi:hypothetical protein
MHLLRVLALLALVPVRSTCSAAEREVPETPLLLVVRRDSQFDIGRVFDAANRDYIRRRIEVLKEDIERNEAELTMHSRKELPRLEKALAELKDTGKPLPGGRYVTVFEEDEVFVVSYFESTTTDHFVSLIRKKDYSPRTAAEARRWSASHLNQKEVIVQ